MLMLMPGTATATEATTVPTATDIGMARGALMRIRLHNLAPILMPMLMRGMDTTDMEAIEDTTAHTATTVTMERDKLRLVM